MENRSSSSLIAKRMTTRATSPHSPIMAPPITATVIRVLMSNSKRNKFCKPTLKSDNPPTTIDAKNNRVVRRFSSPFTSKRDNRKQGTKLNKAVYYTFYKMELFLFSYHQLPLAKHCGQTFQELL